MNPQLGKIIVAVCFAVAWVVKAISESNEKKG